jgi:hypothetical protein
VVRKLVLASLTYNSGGLHPGILTGIEHLTPEALAGLPDSQLAVLPGTTHVALVDRAAWLLSMSGEFLDAPMPDS